MPSKPCKFGAVIFDLSLSLCYNYVYRYLYSEISQTGESTVATLVCL